MELNIYRIRDEPGRGFPKPYVKVDFVFLDELFFLFILVNLVTITVETLLTIKTNINICNMTYRGGGGGGLSILLTQEPDLSLPM